MERKNFVERLLEMQKEFDNIFDNFVEPVQDLERHETKFWQPSTDIYETVDTFIVKMEIPGIQPKKDVEVVLEGNRLIVKGKRPDRTQNQKEHYHQDEINYGPFYRLIQLPDVIDGEAELKANYQGGFLKIVLPKKRVEHKSVFISSESKKDSTEE